jgi:hypothetical protein
VIEQLLKSEQVIIPYEELRGAKQVSSIVFRVGSQFSSLSFVDDDRNFGPTDLINSGLSSREVEEWVKSPDTRSETVIIEEVRVSKRYFLSTGVCAEAMTDIVLVESSGRVLHLSTQGASYSYGFVLQA